MPAEVSVGRVHRDALLDLRVQVLGKGTGGAAMSGDLSPTTRHWAAWIGGDLVGCVSVMTLRGLALRGLAVSAVHQRQGVGAQLLRVVCAEVDASMWCNARLDAVSFYSAMGWESVGPVFSLQGQPHQRMLWRRNSGCPTPTPDSSPS